MWTDDKEKFAWIRDHLYVAVICDVLDSLGRRDQAMHQRLRPLDADNCTMAGRARTLRWMEIEGVDPSYAHDPYGQEIDIMDTLRQGDVIVHSTDRSGSCAPWGELMTTVAMLHKAAGCICDSQLRDCLRIKAMNFPVFAAGIRPLDSAGRARVMNIDVPVRCGEVLVRPGDLIVADFDGVVVVPHELEEQTLRRAGEKVDNENITRNELLKGRSLREVYNQYGVL